MDGDTVITAGTIAAPTIALVALVKAAAPEAPGWVYIVSALGIGLVIAILNGLAQGGVLGSMTAAQWALEGLSAAVLATGTHHLDQAATERRLAARRARSGLPMRRATDPEERDEQPT